MFGFAECNCNCNCNSCPLTLCMLPLQQGNSHPALAAYQFTLRLRLDSTWLDSTRETGRLQVPFGITQSRSRSQSQHFACRLRISISTTIPYTDSQIDGQTDEEADYAVCVRVRVVVEVLSCFEELCVCITFCRKHLMCSGVSAMPLPSLISYNKFLITRATFCFNIISLWLCAVSGLGCRAAARTHQCQSWWLAMQI